MGLNFSSQRKLHPAYVAARRTLLDAVDALGPHQDALVVIGAQAVYLRTQTVTIEGIAPMTTDADLALDAMILGEVPPLEQLMDQAGFRRHPSQVGTWLETVEVESTQYTVAVDLLVPDKVALGSSRRDAGLKGHAPKTARRTVGLEAALIDSDFLNIPSLENDGRSAAIRVAGPGALLVAKLHKIAEREAELKGRPKGRNRLLDKDAGDVYRLFQATDLDEMTGRLRHAIADQRSAAVTGEAIKYLVGLFGRQGNLGIEMAIRSLGGSIAASTVTAVCVGYCEGVLTRMKDGAEGDIADRG